MLRRLDDWFESGGGRRLYPYLLVAPAMVLIVGTVLYPVASGILAAFQDLTLRNIARGETPWVGLANFRDALGDPDFAQAARNTVIWVTLNVAIQLALGLALALLLMAPRPGIALVRAAILIPWVIPSVVDVLTWRWMFDPNVGLVNEVALRLGIVDDYFPWLGDTRTALFAVLVESVWKGTPFVMLMLLAALQMVPRSQIEAAQLDGARWSGVVRHIILPHIRVPLAITAILTFVLSTNNFNAIYLMTGGGPLGSSEILFTLAYRYAFTAFELGRAAAVAVMLFVILAVATTLYLHLILRREAPR